MGMGWVLLTACALCFAATLLLAPWAVGRWAAAKRTDRARLRLRSGSRRADAGAPRLTGGAAAFASLAMVAARAPVGLGSKRGGSHARPRAPAGLDAKNEALFKQSGLEGHVSQREVAALVAVLPVAAGALGTVVLLPLGLAGAVAGLALGAALGWWWPRRTLASLARDHRIACERDVPSMLDIVGMGVRAGLSFDMAFAVFAQRYPGPLARECDEASQLWASGVLSRDEALGQLAQRTGSDQVRRFADIALQAIGFGSSLAPVLDELADEMRRQRRADVEERIAKAPVKMLVPTGVLILPAMLIVVMGPVVLELAQGLF